MSGVTVQEGRYVVVRGLGERYTTASLNGARLPSPEPERRVVPLDIFPAGLLQSVTTTKTFTPDQPGDFSGAQVDIRTREYPARAQRSFSATIGANTSAAGKDLPSATRLGREFIGFAGSGRRLPTPLRGAGNLEGIDQETENRLINSFRNTWSVRDESGLPNMSLAGTAGGTTSPFGRDLGYVLSGTYSHAQEVREGEIRGVAQAGPSGQAEVDSRFEGTTGRRAVLWGGLFNLSTRFGTGSRIAVNNTYNRTADHEARREFGVDENLGNLGLAVNRTRFVERTVRSNQLLGEHVLGGGHQLGWAITSSGVSRREPDRSEIVYTVENDFATGEPLPPAFLGGSNEAAVRTYADLGENSLQASTDYTLSFGGARAHRLKLGGLLRRTERDADNTAYSISTPGRLTREELQLTPEEIFDGRFTQPGENIFNITALGQGGSYAAEDRLGAGYGLIDYGITSRIRAVAGARVERSEVTLEAQPTSGEPVTTSPRYTDVLPSLALNISLTENQNLRLSASQTVSRPEYRELAPILYREVIGAENILGNADLRRALIQNYDARWEWYPSSGEVLSAAVFAKRFKDPIERIFLATSGTRLVSFENADRAVNYGVEIEARKGLYFISPALEPFSAFTNVTLVRSDVTIRSSRVSQASDERPLVGQAPYVVNAGLTYAPSRRTSATLLFNSVGRRVAGAAEAPLPNVYEEATNALDFSVRLGLRRSAALRIDAKNLLNDPYELRQGGVIREYYRTGRVFTVGVTVTN